MSGMLLVVAIAGRRAALPALAISAVVELGSVTPVPRAASHVAGLAALRSRPLTVIDCRAALGFDVAADWREGRAVVVEHEGHLYGLLVDAADAIVRAEGEARLLGADSGARWSRAAQGWVETEAGALPLLDIATLIAGPDSGPGSLPGPISRTAPAA